jgi:hypothetical protein
MSEARDIGLAISKQDLLDVANIIGGVFPTFTAHDYAEMLRIQAHGMDDDAANDLLLEFAQHGQLREVGPGVYARNPPRGGR